MYHEEEQYGALFQRDPARAIASLTKRINSLIAGGVDSPREKGRLARLMAKRDEFIAKTSARKGAALAAASIPGIAGGLASSGIRGMDVVEHEFTPEVIRQHNLEGAAQGLRQMSVAPPGSGRLVRIPFVTAAAVVPVHTLTGATGIGVAVNTVTRSVNWAVLRIVGLTTDQNPAANGVIGVMQDFRIGGSPNLFLNEDNVLMSDYDSDNEQFSGLRAYPVLISPNTAFVDIATFAPAAQQNFVVVNLVVEVLRDDAFGPGLPGAYAR